MEARISFLSFAKILIATLAMTFLFIGNIHAGPLHDAVSCGDVNAVSKLLESGNSLAEEDKAGRTPFSYAVQRHHTQIIRLLIITAITQSGVDMTTTLDIQETPEQASNEIIQPLLATLQKLDESALRKIADILGLNISDTNRNTPLCYALQCSNFQTIQLLIKLGADMSILNWSPLFLAVWQNDINAFNPLTTSYSHDEKDSAGNTLLHLAAMRGGTEILRILISLGSYVHATNNVGETPLHFAARNGHTETDLMLITLGADVNAGNDWNEHEGYNPTALHLALLFETDETIEDLGEDMEMDIPTPPTTVTPLTTLTQPIQPETETNPFACSSLLEWPSYNYDAW